MHLKFKVFAMGEHSFHSRKTDRDIRQARLIGSIIDPVDGSEIPSVADLGFDGRLDCSPSSGDTVILDIIRYETENAMGKLSFSTCSVASTARELKH